MRFPCLDAVAHGEGLCAEPASAPCKPRGNPQDRAASLGELNSPRVAPLPISLSPYLPTSPHPLLNYRYSTRLDINHPHVEQPLLIVIWGT